MQLDAKNCVITVKDGTATTPLTAEITLGAGTISWTEHSSHEYVLDRGKLDDVKLGDEQPLDLNVSSKLEWYTGDVMKLITGEGTPAPVTTDPGACRPYCCDITVVHTPPCGTAATETFIFKYFRRDELSIDLKEAQINFSGKCNILRPTVTKV